MRSSSISVRFEIPPRPPSNNQRRQSLELSRYSIQRRQNFPRLSGALCRLSQAGRRRSNICRFVMKVLSDSRSVPRFAFQDCLRTVVHFKYCACSTPLEYSLDLFSLKSRTTFCPKCVVHNGFIRAARNTCTSIQRYLRRRRRNFFDAVRTDAPFRSCDTRLLLTMFAHL